MKNILNWTLGGFFRTIGRYFAIGLIFFTVSYFLSLSGFKLPSWLSIDFIYADTITNWTTQQARIQTTHDGTDSWSSYATLSGDNAYIFEPTYPVKAIAYSLKYSGGLSRENTYTFQFGYKPLPDSIGLQDYFIQNGTTGEREEITCTDWLSSAGYYWHKCTFSPINSYSSSDYVYVKLNFFQSYLSEIRVTIRGFEERKGTNAVITEQTNDIINNNNQNTLEIINNINQANENLLNGLTEQNQVCKDIDKNSVIIHGKYLTPSGNEGTSQEFGITDYININKATIKTLSNVPSTSGINLCFYNINKELISCLNSNTTINEYITIPQNSYYVRFSIWETRNRPSYTICQNGNQSLQDTLSDTDTSSDSSSASDFFHNFNLSLEGPISQIVLLPINMLQYLVIDYNSNTSHSDLCTTLKGQQICLPSGDILWKRTAGTNLPFGVPNYVNFRTFFQLVVGGFIYYKLCRRLVASAEKGLDPQESGVSMIKL